MREETIHQMNQVLDVANEIIEEDKDYLAKTEHKPTAIYTGNGNDLMEDYMYTRDTLRNLISTGEFALAKLENLLKDSESTKTFEVVATLIKSIAELSGDLIKLQRQMKDIASPITKPAGEKSDGEVTMTTDALNKLLDNRK